jgi:signal transduction histidine kinase
MYADRDGNLWVATGNDGLLRYRDHAIRMYTADDGLPAGYPMALLTGHDGTLWVGNNCGGLSRFDGSRFHTYDEKDGLTNSCVWSLAEDANHDLWVGTWGGGLYRFRDGRFTSYSRAQRLLSKVVFSIAAARDGSLWYATPDGLIHMQNGNFRNYTTADGLSSDRVISVYQDRSGAVWAGTSAGIDRLAGDRFVPVRPEAESEAIPYGPLREDTAGNLYALSVLNGISRIENDRIVSVSGALEPLGMVESADHDFWFGGRSGIFRVAASTLKRGESDRNAPLDYTLFGRADGLNSKECSTGQPNIAMTPDGRLWVGTVKGLAMLDPKRLPQRNRKPAIFMEEAKVGQEKRAPGRELTLRPGTYHVALRFTAVDLSSPTNIRIQYRLDGVDPEWLDADSTRTAVYTNVPVGTHAFHIRATNGDGVWDREGIVYDITQQPYFYETTVFRLGFLAVLGFSVLLFFRFRVHQVTRRIHLVFEERLAERTRIARDLHDTLLQSFQGVLLKFTAVTYMLPDRPPEAKEKLENCIEEARRAVTEGRDAVQGLRSSAVVSNDLARAITTLGERTAIEQDGGHSADFRVHVEGESRDLLPLVRDEIYRLAGEAVRNAFRHARARRIEVEIHYDKRQFRMRVRDDGKGIDPQVLGAGGRAGHHGLPGMHERAKLAGGELTVWSERGSGTEIELRIPAAVAYEKASIARHPMSSGQGSG